MVLTTKFAGYQRLFPMRVEAWMAASAMRIEAWMAASAISAYKGMEIGF